jgi:hypothetical protein
VAVGGRLGGQFGRDCAAGAWTVIDDHLLAEVLRQLLRDEPRHDVGRATGREADEETNRFGGPALRRRRPGTDCDCHCQR